MSEYCFENSYLLCLIFVNSDSWNETDFLQTGFLFILWLTDPTNSKALIFINWVFFQLGELFTFELCAHRIRPAVSKVQGRLFHFPTYKQHRQTGFLTSFLYQQAGYPQATLFLRAWPLGILAFVGDSNGRQRPDFSLCGSTRPSFPLPRWFSILTIIPQVPGSQNEHVPPG